jgi:hypothetical protein
MTRSKRKKSTLATTPGWGDYAKPLWEPPRQGDFWGRGPTGV